MAKKVLELGGTPEEVADILGDSPAIIRRYYANGREGGSPALRISWHVFGTRKNVTRTTMKMK
jgi:hypothetical protein